MLAFLVDDSEGSGWDEDPEADWRTPWHTAIVAMITGLVLGLWLLSSMAHPPGPPPPTVQRISRD